MKSITDFVNTEREIAENQKEILDIQNMLPIESEVSYIKYQNNNILMAN